MLVDRPVDVGSDPGDLDVGFVDEPAISGQLPTRLGRVDQQGCEPLHPLIEGDVVDLDATLGEKLFEVPVGQPLPQIPAHRQQDHLGWETESSEARRHPHRRSRTASALHRATLTATVRCVNATEPYGLLKSTGLLHDGRHAPAAAVCTLPIGCLPAGPTPYALVAVERGSAHHPSWLWETAARSPAVSSCSNPGLGADIA